MLRGIFDAFARSRRRPNDVYRVWCRRDEETRYWYVFKSDIPGLCADAETLDDLQAKVVAMAQDLLEEYQHDSGHEHRKLPLELLAQDPMNHAHC